MLRALVAVFFAAGFFFCLFLRRPAATIEGIAPAPAVELGAVAARERFAGLAAAAATPVVAPTRAPLLPLALRVIRRADAVDAVDAAGAWRA